MNNQLIKKEDVSFLDKVRAFFKGIFSRKNKKQEVVQTIEENKIKETKEFEEKLKVNVSNVNEKENKTNDFIKEIEKNPNILDNLPTEKLDKIINYYKKIIRAKRREINALKDSLN